MTRPLQGIRIADFTVHNAGPFCTHLLSQLGAEVIKIESAMRPDAFRKLVEALINGRTRSMAAWGQPRSTRSPPPSFRCAST